MHIIVLGAGIAGILSAYTLARSGHRVTVIDRQHTAAQECSFANGGQLSYSHAEPWANPYVFKKLFQWMFDDEAPLVLRFSADAQMIRWGLQFLWNCRASAAERNARAMLELGLYSRLQLQKIVEDTGIEFHYQQKGILHVYSSQDEFDHARHQADFQRQLGCEMEALSWEQCLQKEPALSETQEAYYGGIYSSMDESGDIHLFTQRLASYCSESLGVAIHYNTTVSEFGKTAQQITHISTSSGEMSADAYVLALGAASPLLMRKLGVHLPVYPMKGYSVTFPANDKTPHISITDDARKIVYSRLGEQIRCAGTAEFAGYNDTVRAARIAPILRGIKALFPSAALDERSEWACLRPSTPDGPPIIGKTRYSNLFLNTGQGTLGWTQGAGSAQLLADIINDTNCGIDPQPFNLKRYAAV